MQYVTERESMEPTKDDLADTLTATLRELKNLHQKLNTVAALTVFVMIVIVGVMYVR